MVPTIINENTKIWCSIDRGQLECQDIQQNDIQLSQVVWFIYSSTDLLYVILKNAKLLNVAAFYFAKLLPGPGLARDKRSSLF
jgi:hypothetical protein